MCRRRERSRSSPRRSLIPPEGPPTPKTRRVGFELPTESRRQMRLWLLIGFFFFFNNKHSLCYRYYGVGCIGRTNNNAHFFREMRGSTTKKEKESTLHMPEAIFLIIKVELPERKDSENKHIPSRTPQYLLQCFCIFQFVCF